MDLRPGTVLDRYVVEAVLGRGGMATVYRVRHAQLGTVHALKVLNVGSSDIRQRLLQEGRTQGSLRHPNVVAVTDVVAVEGGLGLVMECVEGPSLDRWLATVGRPPLAEADRLARGILEGVLAAHRAGLVHRDLKPGNVLLEPTAHGAVPKVTDFGLVKVLAADLPDGDLATRTGVAMGTPAYMAPEQIRDASRVDARADVFSLGAVLYELVTGRRAFAGSDLVATLNRVIAGDYPPVRTFAPDVPPRMEHAIVEALRADRERRIPDVATLFAIWTGAPPPVSSSSPGSDAGSAATWQTVPAPSAVPTDARAGVGLRAKLAGLGLLCAVCGLVGWVALTSDDASTSRVGGVPVVLADPDDRARLEEAWSALLRVDLDRCARLAGAMTDREPAPLLLEAACLHLRDRPEGVERWSQAAEVAGQRDDAASRVARLAWESGRVGFAAVEAEYRDHLERWPDDRLARIVLTEVVPWDDVGGQLALIDELREDRSLLPHWLRARRLLASSRYADAQAAIDRGLQVDPDAPELLALRGRVLVQQGQFEAAVAALRDAEVRDPSMPELRHHLAVAWLGAGQVEEALRERDRLLDPATPLAVRIRFGSTWLEATFGFGLRRDEEATWALLVEAIRRSDDPAAAFPLHDQRFQHAWATEDPAAMRSVLDSARADLSDPRVSDATRQRLVAFVASVDAAVAASEGRIDDARRIVGDLERRGAHPVRVALARAAVDRAEGGVEDVPVFTGCPPVAAPGGVSGEAECPRVGPALAARAHAHVRRAEQLAGADPAAAAAEIESFRRLWPHADPDHPFVLRANAVASR